MRRRQRKKLLRFDPGINVSPRSLAAEKLPPVLNGYVVIECTENIKETLERLTTAFDKTVPPDLETAKNLVIQLRYLDNVEGVCREWSPGKRIELQH